MALAVRQPNRPAVTPDALRQDVPQVVNFLRAVEAIAPGRTVKDMAEELDAGLGNDLFLELLARALGG